MRSNWRFTFLIVGLLFMSSCIGDLLGCQSADSSTDRTTTVQQSGPIVQ